MRLFSILIFLALGFYAWNNFSPWRAVAACSRPITYSLESFDQRFGISREEFLNAVKEAEGVWETPSARNLFSYLPEKADLSINLVYDYRQAVTQELSELEEEVEETEASYQALERQYSALKEEHESLESAYESRVRALEERERDYESHVRSWNSGSRTSKGEFEALEAERRSLEQEVKSIQSLEETLNSKVRELNSVINRLNRAARALNLNVEEYNNIGASRGETFAGGTYTSSSEGERIDIYEFENRAKLVRILAHELGHALGLEHIEDQAAIMYKLNEGEAGATSPSDLTALKALCDTE
jgi:prefoldin subunit 5